MISHIFDTTKNRWWGLLPLLVLLWHGAYTAIMLDAHYLLFVCYAANLILGIGIYVRSGLMVGTGAGWCLIAFPLWLYYAILNSDWEISGVAFHSCGILVGLVAMKNYRLPGYTWCVGLGLALVLQGLGRMFSDPALNVNAAFRIYDGWEGLFPNYPVYFVVMFVGFAAFFCCLTWLNNRFLYSGNKIDGCH
jgi:hypothetical protein